MRKRLRTIVTAFVLAIFLIYFALNINSFKPLLHLNPFLLLLIAVCDLALISANGLVTKFILEPFNKYISISESIYVALITALGNFFAPAGSGFGIRAVYLKKKHNLAYNDFISTLSGNYVIFLFVNSLLAILALYFLRQSYSTSYLTLLVAFIGLFIFSLVLMVIKLPMFNTDKSIKNKYLKWFIINLLHVINGWSKIVSNKKLMMRLTGVIFFNFIITLIIAKLEFMSIHVQIGLPELILYNVLGGLSLFINITPANLGVKEAIYIFSSKVLGLSVSQIVLVGIIDRGVLFFVFAILWLVFIKLRGKSSPMQAVASKA
jgi:uncharacterized membrane protein YbhN (UPF0104 family)